MTRKEHWEDVYQRRQPTEVSWYQREARVSRTLIERAGLEPDAPIIDVGGGASVLVDELLELGHADITVLDISATAIAAARSRMGARADAVNWMEEDVLEARLTPAHYALWHDRAVFHFFTEANDRARYVTQVRSSMRPGGWVIVATFAADAPPLCSGLSVVRYSPQQLQETFGGGFRLAASEREEHRTPAGTVQPFTYCLFRCDPASSPA